MVVEEGNIRGIEIMISEEVAKINLESINCIQGLFMTSV